ncbi:glycosyltransferase [Williamsia maris]|uniref:UDP:flavonoid glycosyltransferase YjiC, YdhE family n=1 Tax=Williamsia maris TaxID=72806 RepID=A0ABT1HKN0_9NOCA|nr:nucleotide disphospho-sugar-binding domain-containing protein [Williamsia maris]MCP2178498.1 UDP:flavonoid glycosyltransferase YjiC, YdhE family [Williamsia maris]
MRIAIVAGPDAGHAIPAIALAQRLVAAGESVTVFTGTAWLPGTGPTRPIPDGVAVAELPGLDVLDTEDDSDAGAKLSVRAARMCTELVPVLQADPVDLVICDVITVCGGWAAERLGIPWIELSPHPLYEPSVGLPPIGSGLAPGTGLSGRLRDRLMRAATTRSRAQGDRQRGAARESIGLPAASPGPAARLVATLPALEVPRPDWPADAHVVGPLLWEPTRQVFTPPDGTGPLVVVAPSTATTGVADLVDTALEALDPTHTGVAVRVVISALRHGDRTLPPWAVAGTGRQDALLAHADLVVCGGGHGMLAKSLLAGVPVVTVPGGGDQWELANRVVRQGGGALVRPLDTETLRAACLAVLADPDTAAAARRAADGAADLADPVAVCRSVIDD